MYMHYTLYIVKYIQYSLQFWEAKVEDRESEGVGDEKEYKNRKDEGMPIAGYYKGRGEQ